MSNFYILEKEADQTSFTLKKISGNLDMGRYEIVNMKSFPSDNFSATSKKYVDDEVKKTLDLEANRQMKGDLDMNNNSIIGVRNISASNSVVSKLYVDKFLRKSGGTMSGVINFNNRRPTNLPDPTHLLHPANKNYVDEEIKKIKIPLVYNYNFGLGIFSTTLGIFSSLSVTSFSLVCSKKTFVFSHINPRLNTGMKLTVSSFFKRDSESQMFFGVGMFFERFFGWFFL